MVAGMMTCLFLMHKQLMIVLYILIFCFYAKNVLSFSSFHYLCSLRTCGASDWSPQSQFPIFKTEIKFLLPYWWRFIACFAFKVKKILKGILDSIPSPSPSVKIQIIGGKVYLLGDVNKLFAFKSLLTMPSNILPLHLKQTFPPIIWIFIQDEDDEIERRGSS